MSTRNNNSSISTPAAAQQRSFSDTVVPNKSTTTVPPQHFPRHGSMTRDSLENSRTSLRETITSRRQSLTLAELQYLNALWVHGKDIEVQLAHHTLLDDDLFFVPVKEKEGSSTGGEVELFRLASQDKNDDDNDKIPSASQQQQQQRNRMIIALTKSFFIHSITETCIHWAIGREYSIKHQQPAHFSPD